MITPTYQRPEQEAELTRLGQTLALVAGPLTWILALDAPSVTPRLKNIAAKFPMLGSIILKIPGHLPPPR